ncbi:MAG: MFS transporter [Flavobacteriales bacterium]|jgi:MFS family permease
MKTQGLQENIGQFSLLVLLTAFVGAMVGLERSIFPAFAEQSFGIASTTAMLSFIIAFGIAKAITNYYTGRLANLFGRKKLLVIGWIIALPVPILLIYAQQWWLIVVANILLGVGQGLCWSSTVVMKIDLVGEKNRGLAMGLNEFAGYLAVGLAAWYSSYIAAHYSIQPYVFYIGIFLAVAGLLITLFFIKDTQHFVNSESKQSSTPLLKKVFTETSFFHRDLSSITQAGLVNNLNDGMIWGLLPLLLAQSSLAMDQIAIVTAAYPIVWGVSQLFTGKLADHFHVRPILFWGMFVQGLGIIALLFTKQYFMYLSIAVLLGIGTALVYPTFLTSVALYTHPTQRAASLGVFRFWRDLGYAIGALISGIVADCFGLTSAIGLIGLLTLLSALILRLRMSAPLNA